MAKPFGFINSLEDDTKAPKKKFQLYEVEMGFERATVVVPDENTAAFEAEANELMPKSASSLAKLVAKHGGSVE